MFVQPNHLNEIALLKVALCAIFIAKVGFKLLYILEDCHMEWRMTNKWQCYLLKLKNEKNCQNIKWLPHSFYILKVKCISMFIFNYFLCKKIIETIFYNNLCYKIYGYFKFQLFTYHLFSVVHNATLNFHSFLIRFIWYN